MKKVKKKKRKKKKKEKKKRRQWEEKRKKGKEKKEEKRKEKKKRKEKIKKENENSKVWPRMDKPLRASYWQVFKGEAKFIPNWQKSFFIFNQYGLSFVLQWKIFWYFFYFHLSKTNWAFQ